jgi:gamma-glutamylcyclotransferase (GGCT)/AIG2-like uncharacterized protein YtfP
MGFGTWALAPCQSMPVPVEFNKKSRRNLQLYYFAYGSNMNWEQMQRRCPSAKFVCVASLKNYRFAIARHSRLRNCGTANIFAETGSEVRGIVYDVSEQELAILDGFEDGYRRERMLVLAIDGSQSSIEVLVYIAKEEDDVPLPSSEYKQLIVAGAKHWNMPEFYLLMLEQLRAATD